MIEMAMSLEEFLINHPVDQREVDVYKAQMYAEIRAYRLRELREQAGLTQVQVAERIGVGQRQISKIEHGDLETTKIGTIRSYLEAIGGTLSVEYVMGTDRMQVV